MGKAYLSNHSFDNSQVSFMNMGAFMRFIQEYKITEFNPCLMDNYGEKLPKIFYNISKYDKRNLKLTG